LLIRNPEIVSWVLPVTVNVSSSRECGQDIGKEYRTNGQEDRHCGTFNIRRGIFQGGSLSPLLFVVALVPLSMVLRQTKAGCDMGNMNAAL